jgi:phosphatidylserine decarboxylase
MQRIFIWLQQLVPQHLVSRAVGFLAATEIVWIKNWIIHWFAQVYRVDWQDALRQTPSEFRSFNDFFTRELKPGSRPIAGFLSSPADGLVSSLGSIEDGQAIQAKGHHYDIETLLGEPLAATFQQGSFLTVYLAPRDYHRVHFPAPGQVIRARYIPGDLFSVNDITANHIPGLFTRNERLVLRIVDPNHEYYLVLVGAMIVAGIQPFWQQTPLVARQPLDKNFAQTQVHQGEEAGRFLLGSTAIIISNSSKPWVQQAGTSVRMGQALM